MKNVLVALSFLVFSTSKHPLFHVLIHSRTSLNQGAPIEIQVVVVWSTEWLAGECLYHFQPVANFSRLSCSVKYSCNSRKCWKRVCIFYHGFSRDQVTGYVFILFSRSVFSRSLRKSPCSPRPRMKPSVKSCTTSAWSVILMSEYALMWNQVSNFSTFYFSHFFNFSHLGKAPNFSKPKPGQKGAEVRVHMSHIIIIV